MKDFKSGTYLNQGTYKCFIPNPINRDWVIEDMEVMNLLSKADRMIGRLDMYSEHIPNIDLFIRMHVVKEATQSSLIEGTNTNMEEALLPEEIVPLDKRDDWSEVQNYIKAMNESIQELNAIPLSCRLIRDTHRILMQGVRGEHKTPGEFRKSQNWIGGNNINDALFVPPVHTAVPELMGDLEKYIHNEKVMLPDLLKIALIHYQFETIHPFLDGNGRTGRLLITLYLVERNIIKRPILYLSDYLENHRNAYYNAIMQVRTGNKIDEWFKFFLKGIIETSEKGVSTFEKIIALEKENEETAKQMGKKSANVLKVLAALYNGPVIDASSAAKITGASLPATYSLIKDMEKIGLLREISGSKRGKCYVLNKYLGIFNESAKYAS